MRHTLEAKYIGCIIGAALGDSIGELAFRSPDKIKLMAILEKADALRYTDDTAMAMGLAQSLIEKGNDSWIATDFPRTFIASPQDI